MSPENHPAHAAPRLGPKRLFTALAFAEMVTWTLLIAGMIGKYVLHLGELGVRVGGGIHGFVFLSYCVVTVLVARDQRWPAREALLGLATAFVPYATVPFERRADRAGRLGEHWRLRVDHPSGLLDKVAAVVVRRPVASAVVMLALVALTFTGLLKAGPPTQWFA